MWGQGLNHDRKFKTWFTRFGLSNELNAAAGIVYDRSRSGAKIIGSVTGGDSRQEFVDTYPELFPNGAGLDAFKANHQAADGVGRNESPATALYGEIPSTYPTVGAQVDLLSPTNGKTIDYALVTGGINDIGPEDIINPQIHDGTYIENFDRAIFDIGYTRVLALLQRVRAKCPNAVIFYFGFYPGLSYESTESKLRDYLQYENNDDFKWWFNEYIYEETDVDRLVNQAQNRGLWFHGRWQYWTRQAVAAANDAEVGGRPGVVYVPSGFTENNAAYGGQSYLWQDYNPTTDPATAIRFAKIPRSNQYAAMVALAPKLVLHEPKAQAAALEAAIAGPLPLKAALRAYGADRDGARRELIVQLTKEVHRIQHGQIASLAHPNVQGALHWAGLAMERFKRHRATLDRIAKEAQAGPVVKEAQAGPALVPGAPPTLDAELRRYKLRSSRSLAADAGHLEVDSLTLRVTTAADSDPNLAEPVSLVVHTEDAKGFTSTLTYLLTFQPYIELALENLRRPKIKPYPYFEPGFVNRLTVATAGDLYLTDIVGCSVALGDDPYKGKGVDPHKYGLTWRPQQVSLEVNGREVVKLVRFGQAFGPKQHLDLGWPAPTALKPPVVVLPEQIRARPFSKKTVLAMEKRARARRDLMAPAPPPVPPVAAMPG